MAYLIHRISGSELLIERSETCGHAGACFVTEEDGVNTSILTLLEITDVVRARVRYEKRLHTLRGAPEKAVPAATKIASRNATEMLAHEMKNEITRRLRTRWTSNEGLEVFVVFTPAGHVFVLPARSAEAAAQTVCLDMDYHTAVALSPKDYRRRVLSVIESK